MDDFLPLFDWLCKPHILTYVPFASFVFINHVTRIFQLGSGIIKWSGLVTIGDDCNFDRLPSLLVLFQIIIPIVVAIPATLLIPNVHQTEKLIDWEKERWYEDDETEELDDTMETQESESSVDGGMKTTRQRS